MTLSFGQNYTDKKCRQRANLKKEPSFNGNVLRDLRFTTTV